MANRFISKSAEETQNLAKKIAIQNKWRVYGLVGDLGSGKTTFTQAFLGALGVKGKTTSPTFVIIKSYKLKAPRSYAAEQASYKFAYHIDCYRLRDSKELLGLDFKEILKNKNNIILIEWADKIKNLLPKKTKWIYFEHGEKENERCFRY
jgi:tRNA threonylcarbamoyladenosine biosynthesis protein TsaE